MAEEKEIRNLFIKLLIPLIIIVLILVPVALYFSWSDFTSYSLKTQDAHSKDIAFTSSEVYEPTKEMLFHNIAGIIYTDQNEGSSKTISEISDDLNEKVIYDNCTVCSSCTGTNCSSCTKCGERVGDYENCKGCDSDSCSYCYDSESETKFCRDLKQAIKDSYVLDKEIDVIEYAREEKFNSFPLFYEAITSCKNEPIIIGNIDTKEEICYFDKSLIENNPPVTDVGPGPCPFCNTFQKTPLETHGENLMEGGKRYSYDPLIDLDKKNMIGNFLISFNSSIGPPKKQSSTDYHVDTTFLVCAENEDNREASEHGAAGISAYYKSSKCTKQNPNLKYCSENSGDETCILYEEEMTIASKDQYEIVRLFPYTGNKKYMSFGFDWLYDGVSWIPQEKNPISIYEYKIVYYPETNIFNYDYCTFENSVDPNGMITFNMQTKGNIDNIDTGRTKVVLGNLKTERQKNCEFNLYFCDSGSFAYYEDETIVEIYDTLRTINLYTDVYSDPNQEGQGSIYVSHFDFDLDRDYTEKELIYAIESGFDFWLSNGLPMYYYSDIKQLDYRSNSGIVSGDWVAEDFETIQGTTDCSTLEDNNGLVLNSDNDNKRIYYHCKNGDCSGLLRLKIVLEPIEMGQLTKIKPYIYFCTEPSLPVYEVPVS